MDPRAQLDLILAHSFKEIAELPEADKEHWPSWPLEAQRMDLWSNQSWQEALQVKAQDCNSSLAANGESTEIWCFSECRPCIRSNSDCYIAASIELYCDWQQALAALVLWEEHYWLRLEALVTEERAWVAQEDWRHLEDAADSSLAWRCWCFDDSKVWSHPVRETKKMLNLNFISYTQLLDLALLNLIDLADLDRA